MTKDTQRGSRSKSSAGWLREHEQDLYVQRARREQVRSRATYKLEEIDQRDRLFRPGMVVVELGAAPGGWTEYAAARVLEAGKGKSGRVIASDILPMDGIAGVEFFQGDFTEERVVADILNAMGGSRADLVLSDMAPNLSGVVATDQARAMYLAELALDLAEQLLRPQGDFVTKLFQGTGFEPVSYTHLTLPTKA